MWLQERVAKDEVLPVREPTQTNVADLNTKCHPQARFKYLVSRIGMRILPEEVIAIPESKIMKFSTVTSSTAGGISAARPPTGSASVMALAVALANVIGGARGQAAQNITSEASWRQAWEAEAVRLVTVIVLLIGFLWWCSQPEAHIEHEEAVAVALGIPVAAAPVKPAGLPPGIVKVGGIPEVGGVVAKP